MLQRPVILGSQDAMNAADGGTIERRILINQPDEGSARCKGSRAWVQLRDSSPFMQPFTTLSMSNAILLQPEHTESLGHRLWRHGAGPSQRRELRRTAQFV